MRGLEKCCLWGTKPEVLKGQAKRLARGCERRPEVRPGVRSCPGRGAGRGRTAEGGTANSSWEVARAIAKHRKSRSRAQHTFKVQTAGPASPSDRSRGARSSEPGGAASLRQCNSDARHSQAPGAGLPATKLRSKKQSQSARQEEVPGEEIQAQWSPLPFLLNYSVNCHVLFGPGC